MVTAAAGKPTFGIESSMRTWGSVLVLAGLVLLMAGAAAAGTSGSFRGQVVERPAGASSAWIYVRGRNGMIRRVEISKAKVEYDENVPAAERSKVPRETLVEGTEVRVTAEQGDDGEWRASRVEVLPHSSDSEQNAGRSEGREVK